MSWWVYLVDTTKDAYCSYGIPPDEFVPEYDGDVPCPTPCYPSHRTEPFEDGGTYVMGGSSECELNITYNYSRFYYETLDSEDGLRALNNQRAGDWIERLESAVAVLGTDRDDDYWKASAGNAGAALARLLAWARAYPEGIWSVS